jgi:hypothetical protein
MTLAQREHETVPRLLMLTLRESHATLLSTPRRFPTKVR